MAKKLEAPKEDVLRRAVDEAAFRRAAALAGRLGLGSGELKGAVRQQFEALADAVNEGGDGGGLAHQLAFLVNEFPGGELEEELRLLAEVKDPPELKRRRAAKARK
jgi:hypothetical protein